MAADFTSDQQKDITALTQKCTAALNAIQDALALKQRMIDKGYGAGGTHVITDAVAGGVYVDLVAVDLANAFTAFAAIDTVLAATSRQYYTYLERVAK